MQAPTVILKTQLLWQVVVLQNERGIGVFDTFTLTHIPCHFKNFLDNQM